MKPIKCIQHWLIIVFLVVQTYSLSASDDNESDANKSNLPLPNLIRNPGFEIHEGGFQLSAWITQQHAGERAYVINYDDGVATIDKQGEQHWFTLTQLLDPKALLGKSLCFEAEVKLDLSIDGPDNLLKIGGGLSVQIKGHGELSRTDLLIGRGNRVLFSSILKNEPILGQHDWVNTNIAFTVPEEAKQMIIGFTHQADGKMQIRQPRLVESAECPTIRD